MKPILCTFSLSAMALCLGFALAGHPGFTTWTMPEYLLMVQREDTATAIFNAVNECNETWPTPFEEGTKMFQTKPNFVPTSRTAKCLMECTLRKIETMSDDGFQLYFYLRDIKQLMYNYTSGKLSTYDSRFREGYTAAVEFFKQKYEHIQVYERAANACKDTKHIYDDNCETAFRFVQCVVEKGVEYGARIGFFPFHYASNKKLE